MVDENYGKTEEILAKIGSDSSMVDENTDPLR